MTPPARGRGTSQRSPTVLVRLREKQLSPFTAAAAAAAASAPTPNGKSLTFADVHSSYSQ
jgi:hypothetical protein